MLGTTYIFKFVIWLSLSLINFRGQYILLQQLILVFLKDPQDFPISAQKNLKVIYFLYNTYVFLQELS